MATDPIRSERLDLISLDAAILTAFTSDQPSNAASLLGAQLEPGWPDEHDLRFLRMRLHQVLSTPAIEEWSVRAVVLREPQPWMIGHVGFHGPPGVNGRGQGDAVEVGYTIFPDYRGAGYATEAVGALLDWAHGQRRIGHFIASIAPGNAPSIAVVRNLGFSHIGEQWDDEDGLEHVYEARRD
jgi:RimJ/RimL family protein N-acetyltransferase